MAGVGVIAFGNSGVIYQNQTAGSACLVAEAEGHLIPLSNDAPPNDYGASLEAKLSELFAGVDAVDSSVAAAIDALFASHPNTSCVSVDRERMADSREAWVYVLLSQNEFSPFDGFDAYRGVLTWPNSD